MHTSDPHLPPSKAPPPYPQTHPSPTTKRRGDRPGRIGEHNSFHRDIHAGHTNERPSQKRQHAQRGHDLVPGERLPPAAVVPGVVEPEGAGDAVRVPAGEQAGGDADEVVEDGDPDRKDESRGVHDEDERDPDAPPQGGVAVQVGAGAEEAHEEQLGSRVRVQAAGDEEVGDRDPERDLRPEGGQRAEGRAGDRGADVVVRDDREDGVEGRGEALERVGRL